MAEKHSLLLMYCIYKRVWWLLSKKIYYPSFFSNSFRSTTQYVQLFSIFLVTAEGEVKTIQEKLDLDDKLSSGERNKTEKR